MHVQNTIHTLNHDKSNLASYIESAKKVYARLDIQGQMKDGDVTYPKNSISDESKREGMKVEFRYAHSMLCLFQN